MSTFGCFSILALLVAFMTSGQRISMLYESPAPANTTVALLKNVKDAKNDSSSSLCSVAIVIDSSFFVSVANSSATNALRLVKDWMTQVDHAFRSADFNNDTLADNIGLQVVKIALYQDVHDPTLKDSSARTPIQMLSELSRNDYMFKGACVGLHLVHHPSTTSHTQLKASITSPERGICSESHKTPLQVDPLAKSDFGSNIFNAVPVNFKNVEGARVIAHQLGHLFGAMDDEDYAKDGVPCSRNIPAADRDNYIMLESGLGNGDERMVWSDCSLMAINEFLGFKRKASMNCLQECRGDQCGVLLPGNRHDEKTTRDQPLPKPDVGLLDIEERIRTDSPGQHTTSVSQTKTTPKADAKGSQETKATPTPTTTSFAMVTERTTPTIAPKKITAGPGTSRDGLSSYEMLGKSSSPTLVTPKLPTAQNFPTTKSVAVTSAATTEDPSNQPSQSDNQSVDMDDVTYRSLNNGIITRFKPQSDNEPQMDDEQQATDEPPKSTLDLNDTYYISSNSSAANNYNIIAYGAMNYKLFITAVLTLSTVAIYM